MLFHSLAFIVGFLPISVAVFFLLGRLGYRKAAMLWLVGASLFFYAWWNPLYLWLLGASMLGNYTLLRLLASARFPKKPILTTGIILNLLLLGYFKYAHFFLSTVDTLTGLRWTLGTIILPLGISFFTFEQIAALIEMYQGKLLQFSALEYCVFITNFPKLIAGPIIRPHELLPQLREERFYRFGAENVSVGITIFAIGLFKKTVFADSLSPLVGPVFSAAQAGTTVPTVEAWAALLAYTLQIYFDFSGYSDMAIGVARMFGLVLSLNFHSPYKSLSMIEFWRRWHMSLSRYIRDYVYIPLGGSRVGSVRRYLNLFCTMLICGLWHGAGWTFVLWGGLHGLFLVLNHGWRNLRLLLTGSKERIGRWWSSGLAWMTTFLAAMAGWVLFRAESLPAAIRFFQSLLGLHGVSVPGFLQKSFSSLSPFGVHFDLDQLMILTPGQWIVGAKWIAAALLVALFFPNTQQYMRRFHPAFDYPEDTSDGDTLRAPAWKPSFLSAVFLVGITVVSVTSILLVAQREFLYFQF